ncbi:MAG: tRNA glutamyl-Q(34) synthetase GluQRS [Desulfuromonas sp.]
MNRSARQQTLPVGRFAPSPTGWLHFGSIVTALASYCLARAAGGSWLVRMEDLDRPRLVAGADSVILYQLEALGLLWDGPVRYQSRCLPLYQAALERLLQQDRVYPCGCSRTQVTAESCETGIDGPIYSGRCRQPEQRRVTPATAWRLRVAPLLVRFRDGLQGEQRQQLAREVGDFILRRRDGQFAYQLATPVDDADQGVTQVVRGGDLLGSTARQIYLLKLLGQPQPAYVHLPLALHADGRKISKSAADCPCLPARPSPQQAAAVLRAALAFLGQNLPPQFPPQASPAQIIAWACQSFDLRRIDPQPRCAAPDGCELNPAPAQGPA